MKKVIVFIILAIGLFFALKPLFIFLSDNAVGIPIAKYANKGFPLIYYSLRADHLPGKESVAANYADLNIPGWAIVFDNIFDWVIAFLFSGGIILLYSKLRKRKMNTAGNKVFKK